MAKMSQEVIAAAVNVAGDWARHMVSTDIKRRGDVTELEALQKHFEKCFQAVTSFLSDTLPER